MSGSGKQTLPPRADPAPVPRSIQEGSELAGTREQRLRKRQKGRSSLILTEPGIEEKKSVLG